MLPVRQQLKWLIPSLILGKNGIEKIIELDLNDQAKELLKVSEQRLREVMVVLEKNS